jgi:hypothetical protein
MAPTRLLAVLLLSALAFGQQSTGNAGSKSPAEPNVPVVDHDACPFEGCTFGKWKVIKAAQVYTSWDSGRSALMTLRPGDEVIGLTGVHVTRKPDRILVKQAIPNLGLKPGDIVLRYMNLGEGFANLWFNGAWHKGEDASFVTEKDGEGCVRDCQAIVTQEGAKEWWVKVKTSDGKEGWVLVENNFDGMDSLG